MTVHMAAQIPYVKPYVNHTCTYGYRGLLRMENVWKTYGKRMVYVWKTYGKRMENVWKTYGLAL